MRATRRGEDGTDCGTGTPRGNADSQKPHGTSPIRQAASVSIILEGLLIAPGTPV